MDFTRRKLLTGMAVLGAALGTSGTQAARLDRPRLGPAQAFSFEALKERARNAAHHFYAPAPQRGGAVLDQIDYDAYGQIQFRPELSLWGAVPASPSVRFFPPGRYARDTVSIFVVQGNTAREVVYAPDYFAMPANSPAQKLPPDIGFSGFRILNDDAKGDWLAFQGASYFRSSGPLDQYGLSARGIAIDTASARPEEFPRFTAYWLALDEDHGLVIHALLEGPSITGAYRFLTRRKQNTVTQDIECALFLRKSGVKLGVAPLTSMFWYGKNNRSQNIDWRPEIHDTDGLALWTGTGERLWRPLTDPPRVMTNSFLDENPKGFGLLQRDRHFENYEDDGVFYDRRPSAWVEPLSSWGKGSVQLVEIPTNDEIHDNIVAYWVPAEPADAGKSFAFRYRLHWLAEEPYPPPVALNVALRTGVGGIPGQPRPPGMTRLVFDFAGPKLAGLTTDSGVKGMVQASRGQIQNLAAYPVVGTAHWRLMFDLAAQGFEPVDLRAYLARGSEAMSETCLYQIFPSEGPARSPA